MNQKELWYDFRNVNEIERKNISPIIFNYGFTGIMINPKDLEIVQQWPTNIIPLIEINSEQEFIKLKKYKLELDKRGFKIFSKDIKLIDNLDIDPKSKGFFITVKDKQTMNLAIELLKKFKNIVIDFESETNIPLELILAFSQQHESIICKQIKNSDDGWVATMTMEMGSHAVLTSSINIQDLIELAEKIQNSNEKKIEVESLEVIKIQHIGMGDRVCIDTISKLDKDEGMIIGSTSKGGILVSSETHYLPYMELRPFRVNAGGIHSYIWCPNNTTKYLSELKVGDKVLAVNSKGRARIVSVGRIKIERRPMLLIEAKNKKGINVNVIVQDDWHIRIISSNGQVRNSTQLKNKDIILGFITEAGRHLGVKIKETIIEK